MRQRNTCNSRPLLRNRHGIFGASDYRIVGATPILHNDADTTSVPITIAYISAKLIASATLKQYEGANHMKFIHSTCRKRQL